MRVEEERKPSIEEFTDEVEELTQEEGESSRELDHGLVRGLAWSGAARWGGQLITWAVTLVVARLLTPSDYGILATAIVLVGFVELLTDLGLGPAVVQAPQVEKTDIQVAMGLTVLLGVALAALIFVLAPLWASVYSEPRVTSVVKVMSLAVLVTAASAVPNGVLQRRLAFDTIAKAQLSQGILTALVTLALAIQLRSYWALVLGFVAGKAFLAALLYAAAPVRPRLRGSMDRLRSMIRFGLVLTGDRMLYYVRTSFDIALVGFRLGQGALGIYTIALTLARMPGDKIAAVLEPVAFPVFAKAQSRLSALRRHYLSLSVATATLVFPAAIGLALTAHLAIPVVLGTQWSPAVEPARILAVAMPVLTLWVINHPALNALGKPEINFRFSLMLALTVPPAIWVGSFWGVPGVAAAGSLTFVAIAAYGFGVTWKAIELSASQYLSALWPVLSATGGMSAGVVLAALIIPTAWSGILRFVIQVLTGLVVYPAWLLVWHRGTIRAQLRAVKRSWSLAG